ncbi:MAG: purine-nucleoside phosphorylase [Bacteroidales bacterium]|nr:purine-nucleoside phosphorylase [Candidatus Cryptobacteroides onthequi]MCQ2164206.1 purine-nucleoside phosphorylase [Bacteroidales bacterium]
MPTPHNAAQVGDIAKTVIMSGDPLRSKFIAENFLENPVLYNNVRSMLGYTGTYEGKPVSVQGHGMGIPSIGIYSYELYKFYDVDVIIRVGTAGAPDPSVKVGTIIIADDATTDSNYGYQFDLPEGWQAKADPELVDKAVAAAEKLGVEYIKGRVFSSDVFYNNPEKTVELYKGIKGVEMEAYALYANAYATGKKALTIVTVSDNIATGEALSPEERQLGLSNMIKIALDLL